MSFKIKYILGLWRSGQDNTSSIRPIAINFDKCLAHIQSATELRTTIKRRFGVHRHDEDEGKFLMKRSFDNFQCSLMLS